MSKGFFETLKDSFFHVRDISDPTLVRELRDEGIKVDEEGIYRFFFGEHKEYELRIEPVAEQGNYFVAIYKNNVLLNSKLPIWTKEEKND